LSQLPTPTWLHRESIIAARLLIIGVAVWAAIKVALQLQVIMTAVVIGFAIVSLLWPVARWLRLHGVPAVLAALMCVALFLAFFVGLVTFVIAQVVDSWPELSRAITGAVNDINEWVEGEPFGLDANRVKDLLGEVENILASLLSNVGGAAATGLTVVGSLTTVVLIATFFAIFALTSGDRLWKSFVGVLDADHKAPANAAFLASMRTTGNWFYASTITGLVDGLFIGIGLAILDVPLAVPIGALTFIMAYIPLIGATIAGAIAVAVALFSGGISDALWALGIVLLVQQIEGNILSPLLLSRAINFHPLIVLILTTSAATAFGLVGLFLAVPVTGAIVGAAIAWRKAMAAPGPEPPMVPAEP
jgi:predicted PurR-regulated permease PerM